MGQRHPRDRGAYVKSGAHDPGSIDVANCSEPVLMGGACWVTTCEVRGTNALGAKVLNRMRFNIGKDLDAPAVGRVTSAKRL